MPPVPLVLFSCHFPVGHLPWLLRAEGKQPLSLLQQLVLHNSLQKLYLLSRQILRTVAGNTWQPFTTHIPIETLSRRYNTGKNTVLPKRNYCKAILHHYFQIQQKSYVRKRALHLPRYLYLILLKVFSMIQGMLAIWSLVPLPVQKQGSSRKTSTSASLTMLKPLTVWITTNCRKFLKSWEYRITLPVP